MALSRDVKQYVVGRIHDELNSQARQIREDINADEIEKLAIDKLLNENGLSKKYARMTLVSDLRKKLDLEYESLTSEIGSIIAPSSVNRYYWNAEDIVRSEARKKYYDAILREKHPQAHAQLENIEKIRSDTEGVVLLSTTPARLRESLLRLLERYDIHLDGIETILD